MAIGSDGKPICAVLSRRGREGWRWIPWEQGQALTGLVRAVPGVDQLPLPDKGTKKWTPLGAHIFGTRVVVYAVLGISDEKRPDRNYTRAEFDLIPC